MRINLETIAVQLIFSAIDQNMYDMVYSPVHVKEISAISDQIERFELYHLLQETGKFINVDKVQARKRAEKLVSAGLGPADAAHLLFARGKRVESVKRHRDWQQILDKDAFFDEIFGDHKQGIS